MSTAPQPQPSMDAAFRVVRILHLAMLAASVLYLVVGEVVASSASRPTDLDPMLGNIFLVLGFGLAFAAIMVRQKLVASSQETLLRSPADAVAVGHWRLGHVLPFALAEAVVLFGLVLRILGAPLTTAAILYAIGIVALLIVAPRRP
jgi:hypothetical protein